MKKSIVHIFFNQSFKSSIFIALLFFCIAFNSFAQSVKFDPICYNITTEQGLPSLETYSVKQDSKGYIWICTDAGVCRYDGFYYKTFTIDDGLTDNVVFNSYEDYKGRIWFLTYNSLLCYYENGKIVKYKYNNKISEIVHEEITGKSIIIDSQDNVYYSLRFLGMYKIDKNGKYEQLHKTQNSYYTKIIEGNGLISIRVNNEIYGRDGINKLKINGLMPQGFDTFVRFYTSNHYPMSKFNIDNNYVLFNNCIYDLKRNEIVFYAEDIVTFKIIDSYFWICTLKGLIKAKLLPNGKLEAQELFFEEKQFSNITKIDDSYLMSTIDNGIIVCKDFDFQKTNFTNGLLDGSILSVAKLKNEIYVTNSIKGQNLNVNKVTNFNIPQRSSKKILSYKDYLIVSSSHKHAEIAVLKEFNAKILFLGYSKDIKIRGNYLYSCSDALSKFNLNSKTVEFERLYSGWEDESKLRQTFINAVEVLPNGQVIIGGNHGLFEVKNKMLIPVNIGLDDLKIETLNFDEYWGLIIGTNNNGIYMWKNGILSHYNQKNGLLNNQIREVEVNNHSIYIGTVIGLNVISNNKGSIDIISYSKSNFFENLDVNCIYVDNQWVYLGANNGLVKLSKSKLLNSNKKNKTKVSLQGVFFDGNQIENAKNISFPYSGNLLQLKFSVFQYSNWTNKKFQYQINNSGQWVDLESPMINLYRPTGSLDVEIRFLQNDMSWSQPSKLCHIEVVVPYWNRWYFWVIVSSFILLIIFGLYQRRQKFIHQKLVYESQMLSLEQQMQHARMNPHFIFNVFNSIHNFMLNQNIEEAEKYLMRFSRLMREILSNSNEGTILIENEKSILNKYLELEQLRFKNSFDYEISIPDKLLRMRIPTMIIQPFVENAIYYSDKTGDRTSHKISVIFTDSKSDAIQVVVENSGIPTDENYQKMQSSSTKNAIGITRKRLNNYNKLLNVNEFGLDIEIIDQSSTRIVIRIPIIEKQ